LTKVFSTSGDTDVTGDPEKSCDRSVGDKASKPPEKAMKTRLFILAGLAISFALPCIAQDKNTVDPQVRQEIEAVLVKYDEAYNKGDAAAMAARYTENAIFGGYEGGPLNGPHAIERGLAHYMAEFPPPFSHELLQVYQLGIDVCAISKLSVGQWKGYGVFIFVREADGWKIRSEYYSTLIE
jgi:ketosteroid isomerase-like protein